MALTVRRVGNSLGLVISKEVAESLGLKEGSRVRIVPEETPFAKFAGTMPDLDRKRVSRILREMDRADEVP